MKILWHYGRPAFIKGFHAHVDPPRMIHSRSKDKKTVHSHTRANPTHKRAHT
jgi:hypothetical protein